MFAFRRKLILFSGELIPVEVESYSFVLIIGMGLIVLACSCCMETINLSSLVSKDIGVLQDKKSLKLGPEDNLHLEGFALNVFAKADKQDRSGRADL